MDRTEALAREIRHFAGKNDDPRKPVVWVVRDMAETIEAQEAKIARLRDALLFLKANYDVGDVVDSALNVTSGDRCSFIDDSGDPNAKILKMRKDYVAVLKEQKARASAALGDAQ